MIEVKGNLWDFQADARVITTNGFVKADGKAVMGRGCAKEAAERFPEFPSVLGKYIKNNGNHVYGFGFGHPEEYIYTFPVKDNWWEAARVELIERSCKELVELVNELEDEIVVLPRPGCGNGKLNYLYVKPILEKFLDDRFYVITYG